MKWTLGWLGGTQTVVWWVVTVREVDFNIFNKLLLVFYIVCVELAADCQRFYLHPGLGSGQGGHLRGTQEKHGMYNSCEVSTCLDSRSGWKIVLEERLVHFVDSRVVFDVHEEDSCRDNCAVAGVRQLKDCPDVLQCLKDLA